MHFFEAHFLRPTLFLPRQLWGPWQCVGVAVPHIHNFNVYLGININYEFLPAMLYQFPSTMHTTKTTYFWLRWT